MNTLSLVNGVATDSININDRGLHYGDGLFETLAFQNECLQFAAHHFKRLRDGASVLGIDYPGDDVYLSDIRQLLTSLPEDNYVIKIMLTRGQGKRGYASPRPQQPTRIVQLSSWPENITQFGFNELDVCICQHTLSSNSRLAGLKHLNRLDNIVARNEWHNEYDEGLMTDDTGYIIEATMSNVFFVRDKQLLTPSLSTAGVNGIIRQQLLELADINDIDYCVRDIHIDELESMHECFVCNSLIAVSSVKRVNDIVFESHVITKALSEILIQRIKSEVNVIK